MSSDSTYDFLTGSKFHGQADELGMQKYGTYIYPDGTRYLGQFLNDRFHGRGTFNIPEPYGVNFQVIHYHGKLVQICKMSFMDDLAVDFQQEQNDSMSFVNWKYCTPQDRRLHTETLTPLAGVGPYSDDTQGEPKQADLKSNIFDLGFGQFNCKSQMMSIHDHMTETKSFYLGCADVRQWIRQHCRNGKLRDKRLNQKFTAKQAREIIRNNLDEEKPTMKQHETSKLHRSYICHRTLSQESSDSGKEMRLHIGSTSDTSTSIVDGTLKREPSRECKNLTGCKSTFCCGDHQMATESKVCRIN